MALFVAGCSGTKRLEICRADCALGAGHRGVLKGHSTLHHVISTLFRVRFNKFFISGSDLGSVGLCSTNVIDYGSLHVRRDIKVLVRNRRNRMVPFLENNGCLGIASVDRLLHLVCFEEVL